MIKRIHRFQGRGSLAFVYKRGQAVRGRFFSLRYVLNQRTQQYRIAVVASRKVSKLAVVRNRIRRRIYEIIREVEPEITMSYDLVFVVYDPKVNDIPLATLKQLVKEQLAKARVLPVDGSSRTAVNGIVDQKEPTKNV